MKICLLIMLSFPLLASAGIYKWVDDNGSVHFGDKAGNNDAVELNLEEKSDNKTININNKGEDLSRNEKRQRLLDVMNEDREERVKLKEEERVLRNNNKIRCAELKDKLKNVKRAAGVYSVDKDGEKIFLSKKARLDSENKLKKAISKNCG